MIKMNPDQFKYLLLKKYNINCLYWAPEIAIANFKRQYIPDNYQLAMIVLTDYHDAFKNRIEGVIVDDWLCKESFLGIINECIDVLFELSDPKLDGEVWQRDLLNLFQSFKND